VPRWQVADPPYRLPDDEAAGWRAEFAAQLERFGVAEAA